MSPWLKVDERFSRGRKVKRAALALGGGKRNRARILAVWVDAMSYCNLHLTDGLFPDDEMDDLPDAAPDAVFAAMAVGDDELGAIVERDDKHKAWRFRNYADYQQTKSEVESKREQDRLRKRVHRSSDARPHGQIAESRGTDPIRSDPDRTDPTDPKSGGRARDGGELEPVWRKPETAAHGAGSQHGLINGADIRRHAGHIAGCERDKCVDQGLHAGMCRALGTEDADSQLRAWYPAVLRRYQGVAIGDDRFEFWRHEFAAWVGTVTKKPVRGRETVAEHTIRESRELLAALDGRRPVRQREVGE